jgi:uncharacterized protein YjdB
MKALTSNLSWVVLSLYSLVIGACADAKGMQSTPAIDLLQVLPASGRVSVGETIQLGAQRLKGSEASNVTDTVTWSSDNDDVVKVAYDKEVGAIATAVGPGTAHIKADDDGVNAMAEIIVQAAITSLELDVGLFEIAAGTSKALGATLIASDGGKRELDTGTWGSSDPEVASVDADGVITGGSVGEARITLTRDGLTATQTVFVRDWKLESIDAKVVGGTKLLTGGSAPIRVTGQFSDGHTQNISGLFTFSVDKPDPSKTPPVAVDGSTLSAGDEAGAAKVQGAGKGIAAGESVSLDITVVPTSDLKALDLDLPESASTNGEILTFTATGDYGNGLIVETSPDAVEADPEGIVYVDSASGTITPMAAGTVKITATTTLNADDDDDSNDMDITVSKSLEVVTDALSSVALEPASDTDLPSIDVGKSTNLIALASFGSSVVQDVSEPALWTSSDPSIAVVSNVTAGHITGLKAGTVTIKATYKTQSGELQITVK